MVNITRFFKNEDNEQSGQVLPLLPLRDIVIFPQMVAPLFVGRPKSVAALSNAMNTADKYIFLSTQRSATVDNPGEKDISRIGVIAFAVARPILRLKGHYLAMATLGLGIIISIVISIILSACGAGSGPTTERMDPG